MFNYTLLDYYDKLDFDGYAPANAATWNFGAWQADAVVLTIGHNDRFQAKSRDLWIAKYSTFVHNTHSQYPNAEIFCANTSISDDATSWKSAVLPLLSDPTLGGKIHFQLTRPVQPHGGHPRLVDHQGMAFGTSQWNSMVNWVADTLDW